MRRILYLLLFVWLFVSCSKHETAHKLTDQNRMTVEAKEVYSVCVFGLFHPHELIIREKHPDRFRIRLSSGIINATGQTVVRVMDAGLLQLQVHSDKYISNECTFITPSEKLSSDEFELEIPRKLKRTFVGGLEIKVVGHELEILVLQKRENLIASVLSGETSVTDPAEYLKAMAVVSRSYILSHPDRHVGYDFCDNTHCQVFYGDDNKSEIYRNVVKSTADEIITSHGKVFPALYSAVCGGGTIASDNIWTNQDSSVSTQSVKCIYCSSSKYYHWERSILPQEFYKVFNLDLHDVLSIRIDSSDRSGPDIIRINYVNGTKQMTIDEFRLQCGRTLGWNKILSNRFSLSVINNRLVVAGNGFGHNAGFCQAGAKYMAQNGKSYLEIISYYFPEATVERIER